VCTPRVPGAPIGLRATTRHTDQVTTRGLLLAAGAGRRMGTPKALVSTWLLDSLDVLRSGGCAGVTLVLGAQSDDVLLRYADRLPPGTTVLVADDWDEGMGASLRTGLSGLPANDGDPAGDAIDAALVHLVDLPDVSADVVRRVLGAEHGPASLARAAYDGVPGHPVLLGREHWDGVAATARGDQGARAYLKGRDVELVECGDLATGHDQDSPLAADPEATVDRP
jgi:CTP:molybdopterin cytidylyltransferase MocA